MEYWGLTDSGIVRKQNQDYYLIHRFDETTLAAVVCDGMGGAKSGNIASKLAAETFMSELKRAVHPGMDAEKAEAVLLTAVNLANIAVFENSQLSPDYEGMGTTLVAILVLDGTGVIANVGDSRAYLLNGMDVKRITTDHSVVEMMVQRGELRREEAKSYPGKNLITRAVGTELTVECDLFRIPLQTEDNVLLCTDGLSNLLADQELLFETVHGVNKSDCCMRLLSIARQRGAPDNVTAVLISL